MICDDEARYLFKYHGMVPYLPRYVWGLISVLVGPQGTDQGPIRGIS